MGLGRDALDGDEEAARAAVRFQESVVDSFATLARIAKVEIVRPGTLMQVTVLMDALFRPGEDGVRSSQRPLLDRVVTALSAPPRGLRFETEFLIGGNGALAETLAGAAALEVRRAGSFAREMLERGAPPDVLSIGIKPGSSKDALIVFRVHTAEQNEPALAPPL